MIMEDKKREPCPFCGGTATAITGDYSNNPTYRGANSAYYVVVCDECEGNSGEYDTKDEALQAWNKRYHKAGQ